MTDLSVNTDSVDFWIATEVRSPRLHVLTVHGEADLHTAPELREQLTAAIDGGAQQLVLDLSETTFLDSMSLGVLLGAMKRVRAREGEMRLVVTRPDVRRIFEITLLDRVFTIDDTREAALRAVAARDSDGLVEAADDGDAGVQSRDLQNASNAGLGGDE